ncbi:MAG: RluA family pseudouridine synthase [Gammaproteobacteria bacterium]|nr:RluA family pseudouridine synthase [Gammaproteobacteria bacterium]
MSSQSVRHVLIDGEDAGQRIDNFLLRELKGVPKGRIYRMLRRGEVRINGGRIGPRQRLAAGDSVRIPPVRTAHPSAPAAPGKALIDRLEGRILFEDDGLLVIDKPSGLAVHGGSGIQLGLIEALRVGRNERFLELAHRLDRDTSGCLMIAKSRATLAELHRLLRAQRVRKSYQLLVSGRWPRRRTVVERPLHRFVTAAGERRVRVDAQGKPARTTFNVLRECVTASWLSARLHSGRTHQIRVHAASSGHPVLGEDKYETAASEQCSKIASVNRLCLHAVRLSFEWNGAQQRFEAPVPPAFDEAWSRLSAQTAR